MLIAGAAQLGQVAGCCTVRKQSAAPIGRVWSKCRRNLSPFALIWAPLRACRNTGKLRRTAATDESPRRHRRGYATGRRDAEQFKLN
jgi:hypothetical protein